jgi:hypothetical protein
MVEIGRVGGNAGNAPIEQKISAYPPQADICFVSTSLETKRTARRALPGLSGGPNANGSGWLRTALGPEPDLGAPIEFFKLRVASAARRQRPASTTTIVLGAPTALVSAAALGLAATLVLAWASG